jgi:hypothetical protein
VRWATPGGDNKSMQIRVQDPAARHALETAFAAAGCPTLPSGDLIEVVHSDPIELGFFLRAWRLVHPDVDLEVETV